MSSSRIFTSQICLLKLFANISEFTVFGAFLWNQYGISNANKERNFVEIWNYFCSDLFV